MILDYLNQIAATSKRNEKIELLSDYLSNDLFVKVVKHALDDTIRYHMKELPEPNYDVEAGCSLSKALDHLEPVYKREITGNKALDWVADILGMLNDDDRVVLSRVIKKDLRCGVSAKTVNKAAGEDLVYIHPYMRYSAYNEKNLDKIEYPALIQHKIDGLYMDMIVRSNDETIQFVTRNGITIVMPQQIVENILERISLDQDLVLQGEAIIYADGKYLSRKESNGIFNSGSLSDHIDDILFNVWDCVPLSHFEKGKSEYLYSERYAKMVKALNGGVPHIEIVHTEEVEDLDQANEFFQQALNEGYEGSVLKNKDMVWKDGTTRDGVKMKPVREADLIVTAWNYGEGKYANGVGSLTCESSDGLIEVNVAGLSDEQRGVCSIKDDNGNIVKYETIEGFNPDSYIGRIVVVQYNEIITNDFKPGKYSLFLPRVKKNDEGGIEFRIDKDDPDSYNDLLEKEKGG